MNYRNYDNGRNYFWIGLIIFLLLGGFKTLFLLLPVLISFIPIIIVGYILMRLVRKVSKNNSFGQTLRTSSVERNRYVELLVRILVHAVQADGKVDPRELQAIYNYFSVNMRYSTQEVSWIKDLVQHALNTQVPLDELCAEFSTQFPGEASYIALQLIYQIMHADGVFSNSEEAFVKKVVIGLKIRPDIHDQIRAHFVKEDSDEKFYQVLGVSSSASLDEIKKAYKSACKQYHPDKVQHLGEEFRKVAEEKIKEINHAYSTLKKKHG